MLSPTTSVPGRSCRTADSATVAPKPERAGQVDLLRELHLDVPQVTDLAQRLSGRGLSLPLDILTVKEMVMQLCPSD